MCVRNNSSYKELSWLSIHLELIVLLFRRRIILKSHFLLDQVIFCQPVCLCLNPEAFLLGQCLNGKCSLLFQVIGAEKAFYSEILHISRISGLRKLIGIPLYFSLHLRYCQLLVKGMRRISRYIFKRPFFMKNPYKKSMR